MKNTAMSGRIIRFSPVVYHPALSHLDKLVRDICMVSQQHGVELIRCEFTILSPISSTNMAGRPRLGSP
jgi:hypothetical protein